MLGSENDFPTLRLLQGQWRELRELGIDLQMVVATLDAPDDPDLQMELEEVYPDI